MWTPNLVLMAKILYTEYNDISWSRHIAVMNSDGSDKEPLTNGDVDGYPAYSPDGTKIAFARWGFRGDFWDLMMMNADGSNVIRITFAGIPGKMEGSYSAPKWSEDGAKLIFYYSEGPTGYQIAYWICTMNVDGTGLAVIGRGMFPRFVHNDTKILFNTDSHVEGTERIAIMDSDGTNVRILTDGPADVCPHMSSRTNRILFFRISGGNFYVMNEDGTNLEPLVTDDECGAQAEWSPDEKWIAYSSTKSGNLDIWKMEAPTSLLHPSPPRDLIASPRLSSIDLVWNDPTEGLPIQSFRVYRGVSSGGETLLASVDGSIHTYVDSSVSTSLYFYYVTAVNSVGESSPSNEVSACAWTYIFTDSCGRNTVLKINVQNKLFQFTSPSKDFGVKHDPGMTALKNVIVICYDDSTMRLIATAIVGKIDFCSAIAWDKQTGKMYLLIDYPGRASQICPTK